MSRSFETSPTALKSSFLGLLLVVSACTGGVLPTNEGGGGRGGIGGPGMGESGGSKGQGSTGGRGGAGGGQTGIDPPAMGGSDGLPDAEPAPPDAGTDDDAASGPTDDGATTPGAGGATGSPVVGPAGFHHPGVVVNLGQLDFIKAKIAAGAQPWKGDYDALVANASASKSYTPKPVPDVNCGPYSNPSIGCSDEWKDGMAAYAQALLWYLSGDEAYAKKSIQIMNAWAATLKSHSNSNAPLQTGWAGAEWPRAAEIIRYTYKGWADADVAAFETMLKTIYLPAVINGSSSNGNWELTMTDAAMGIAVFLDDKPSFDKAVTLWRQRVPAYFYLTTDGPKPISPPRGSFNWYGLTTYMDGVAQETCRDLVHTGYAIASSMYIAETALIQGVDLYKEQAKRLSTAMEFHANFLTGATVPSWLCGGTLTSVTPDPTWEIGYNEFANRLGMDMPHTKALIAKIRPTKGDHHMAWESMTHAEVGWAGLK